MPVTTLRIWEQRYQAVGPTTAPSGHRLYSTEDVERVVMLRKLTEQGHAIGSLAALTAEQLEQLVRASSNRKVPAAARPLARTMPLRIVVVGQGMARRLKRPAVGAHWTMPPEIAGVYDSLGQALQAASAPNAQPVDLLLWHIPELPSSAAADLAAVQSAWQARGMAVVYRFALPAERDVLVSMGASVVREPPDDEALVAWLESLGLTPTASNPADAQGVGASGQVSDRRLMATLALGASTHALPKPRFDDATLTEFAGMSPKVACECPNHVAELLMQIASFETYSASCTNRTPADAALHAYLQRVAGTARLLFESAMEQVAIAEGLSLP